MSEFIKFHNKDSVNVIFGTIYLDKPIACLKNQSRDAGFCVSTLECLETKVFYASFFGLMVKRRHKPTPKIRLMKVLNKKNLNPGIGKFSPIKVPQA